MRTVNRLALLLCGLLAGPVLAQTTVLTARRIHTMDATQPQAQAMAFDASGKILAVGQAQALLARYPGARVVVCHDAALLRQLHPTHQLDMEAVVLRLEPW